MSGGSCPGMTVSALLRASATASLKLETPATPRTMSGAPDMSSPAAKPFGAPVSAGAGGASPVLAAPTAVPVCSTPAAGSPAPGGWS